MIYREQVLEFIAIWQNIDMNRDDWEEEVEHYLDFEMNIDPADLTDIVRAIFNLLTIGVGELSGKPYLGICNHYRWVMKSEVDENLLTSVFVDLIKSKAGMTTDFKRIENEITFSDGSVFMLTIERKRE